MGSPGERQTATSADSRQDERIRALLDVRRGDELHRAVRGGAARRGAGSAGRRGRGPARPDRGAWDRAEGRLRSRGRRAGDLCERRACGGHHGRAPALPQGGQPLRSVDGCPGGRPREAHRARGPPCEGHDGQRESAPRDLHRAPLPGQPAHPARPDPGGDPGLDPGDREVRLETGLQVLDVCHLVDPAGRRARHRERSADDQAPRVRRRAGEEDRSRTAPADHGPRPPADRGGDRSRPPRCRSRRYARRTGRGADRDQPRQAARRAGEDVTRRRAREPRRPRRPRRWS